VGLYAAGNTSASVFGPMYPGAGASIAASMIFSLIAVNHMAAQNRAST
jgi:3-oxosteroid 1-dehydrogenase